MPIQHSIPNKHFISDISYFNPQSNFNEILSLDNRGNINLHKYHDSIITTESIYISKKQQGLYSGKLESTEKCILYTSIKEKTPLIYLFDKEEKKRILKLAFKHIENRARCSSLSRITRYLFGISFEDHALLDIIDIRDPSIFCSKLDLSLYTTESVVNMCPVNVEDGLNIILSTTDGFIGNLDLRNLKDVHGNTQFYSSNISRINELKDNFMNEYSVTIVPPMGNSIISCLADGDIEVYDNVCEIGIPSRRLKGSHWARNGDYITSMAIYNEDYIYASSEGNVYKNLHLLKRKRNRDHLLYSLKDGIDKIMGLGPINGTSFWLLKEDRRIEVVCPDIEKERKDESFFDGL